jgi:membrane dipeptidase
VFIVDAHEDIASNALHHGRDVRRSVFEAREREVADPPTYTIGDQAHRIDTAMVGLPEHRRGTIGMVFATIFTMPGEQEVVTADALAQLRYYQRLASNGDVRLIMSQADLNDLLRDWCAEGDAERRPVGFVLLMEGADPLRDPAELEEWQRQGLRIVGPAWRGTKYTGGTGAPGPLTDLGRGLLSEMARLGTALDISHMAEESFWQALDAFSGTVIASHSNCREYVPTDRHLSDDMIRAIAARDGVIGTVLANSFLVGNWERGSGVPVPLDAIVRHIDRVCQLTGSARHSAIGSDFDGGFGVESTPDEFDTVGDLGKLAGALERAGYDQQDIAGILGANWLRILERALPA